MPNNRAPITQRQLLTSTLSSAAACVAAGCDVALHCDGNMENMLLVAGAVPPLSNDGEARLARAMAMRFAPDDEMDFAEAVAKRDVLLALA